MRYTTKSERLSAVVDAYQTHIKPGPFTLDDVINWAMPEGLLPPPKRGDSIQECDAWEEALQPAIDRAKPKPA